VAAHFHVPHGIPSLDQVRRQGWRDRDGALVRRLRFRDREQAVRAGEFVALHAVDWLRRPDMSVAQNELRLVVANPNNAGVTAAERRLAGKVSAVLENLSAQPPS
jgi:pterin-4a-carbinolamine dehydratase